MKRLRALEPSDVPVRPMTLAEAIESGDHLQILLAQRRDIAAGLPDEKGPARAALHRQLTLISNEIEALRVKESENVEFGTEQAEDFDATAI